MSVPSSDATPLCCLVGPTASGKSAAALALAQRLPIEIVSVDSALVYRGMDIGTAKPGAAERAAVPHHLIDLIDPAASYSAARFVADANGAIDDIRRRDRIPLLVGGTMLYLKALREGLDEMPAIDPAVRAGIEAEAARDGWPALHRRLAAVDPDSAARLAPLDAQRVSRALEVWRGAGVTLSSLQRRRMAAAATQGARPSGNTGPPVPLAIVSLEPSDRAVLHARIARRFDAMLAAGFEDEVRALRSRGDLDVRMPSMRCVGYRQMWEHLDGLVGRTTMRERAVAATRQLAKRQLTWLRASPDRVVVDADAADAPARAVDALMRAMR